MKSSPEPLIQIQNNFTEMFLVIPCTKIAYTIQLDCKEPPKLKIEISFNNISLTTCQNIISCARIPVSDPGPLGPHVLLNNDEICFVNTHYLIVQ